MQPAVLGLGWAGLGLPGGELLFGPHGSQPTLPARASTPRRAPQGYMCATASPCLADRGGCTQRCVPLAATFCADICPNALDAVPVSGAAANTNGGAGSRAGGTASPDLAQSAGSAAGAAAGAAGGAAGAALSGAPGSGAGRAAASKGLRDAAEPGPPVVAEKQHVWTLPPLAP